MEIAPGQQQAQAAVAGLITAPLFNISWNLTANYVQYDARLRDGKFDPKEPVAVYWVMKATDGHREPLTFIERLKGYGFSIHPGAEPDTYDMVIVSVKKKTLHIRHTEDGHFDVTLNIGDCDVARLSEVHVQAHKWHFVAVGDYADLVGTDVKTGVECRERVRQD